MSEVAVAREVDLTNCDREPIHQLGAIQPIGFLIVLTADWHISNVSRNIIGVRMMAPTVVAFAPAELQTRFLRRAFNCEEIWCQLFSEPGGAGR